MGHVDSEEPFPVTHWWRCNKVICVMCLVFMRHCHLFGGSRFLFQVLYVNLFFGSIIRQKQITFNQLTVFNIALAAIMYA